MSETNVRRSFLAQPANPAALDLQFRRIYSKANQAWVSAHEWPLFREPKEADVYMLQQLRLPLNDHCHKVKIFYATLGRFDETMLIV
jgi:hypothetical protein